MPNLLDDIRGEANVCFDGGRTNNLSDLGCAIGAIAASAIAAVLAAINGVPGWLTAIIAGLPAVLASLQRVVDFRGRSAWYFIKYSKLRDLSLRMQFDETIKSADAAARYGAILTEMEERWADLVKSGGPAPTTTVRQGTE